MEKKERDVAILNIVVNILLFLLCYKFHSHSSGQLFSHGSLLPGTDISSIEDECICCWTQS